MIFLFSRLILADGITSDMLKLGVSGNPFFGPMTVHIEVGTAFFAVEIENVDRQNVLASLNVEEIEFEDGSKLTYQGLLARGFDIDGTALADVLTGTNITDRISGLQGDDADGRL